MANKPFSLGRGLASLIPKREAGQPMPTAKPSFSDHASPHAPPRAEGSGAEAPQLGRIHEVPIGKISPNPRQPRHRFDRASLDSLIASIREHGIIEPLVARHLADGSFELIAGERRLRAATALGLTAVPVIVRETKDDREKLLLALVENLSRQDLNAIEEAEAYRQLNEEFGFTQEQIAARVGKGRPTVANLMRLLTLPEPMQQAVIDGRLSPAQAKVLAGIDDEAGREKMFGAMLKGGVTVRIAEEAAREHKEIMHLPNAQTSADAESLRRLLGTKVAITGAGRKGAVKIAYFSEEEYRELMKKLGAR
jgi:ParB family transcriptional regulator, chromosome partitioning protein